MVSSHITPVTSVPTLSEVPPTIAKVHAYSSSVLQEVRIFKKLQVHHLWERLL